MWWNTGTVIVTQCGGIVVKQWNSRTVTVEQCWWNSEKVMLEQCGGTLEQ